MSDWPVPVCCGLGPIASFDQAVLLDCGYTCCDCLARGHAEIPFMAGMSDVADKLRKAWFWALKIETFDFRCDYLITFWCEASTPYWKSVGAIKQ